MATPTINNTSASLAECTQAIKTIQKVAQELRDESAAGSIRGMQILTLSDTLDVQRTLLVTLLAVPNLTQQARTEFSDNTLNYVNEVNATLVEAGLVIDWIVTNAPQSGGFIHVMGLTAQGRKSPNMVSTGALADLRTAIDALLATIA